jgi:hypothetical protein
VACPFFMPTDKLENGAWLHAERLPLGCGWTGHCTAPGHEGTAPLQRELRDFCNLGYASSCVRLPQQRIWDSVRFSARALEKDERKASSSFIQIRYSCERDHRPVEHGALEFDPVQSRWTHLHHDNRVQRMAECFLQSYIAKRKSHEVERAS